MANSVYTMKYFAISGLGADKRVFQYLNLNIRLIPIDWIAPKDNETITEYSSRLIHKYNIDKELFVIIGVSFGGLIATEISKLVQPELTFLISSAETRNELSGFLKLMGKIGIIDIIPRKFLKPPKLIAKYLFGTKQKNLLNAIIDDTDLKFAKWAIKELLSWKNETSLDKVVKIGGSNDKLIPQKAKNTILIDGGGHFMIVDRADEISFIIIDEIKKLNIIV